MHQAIPFRTRLPAPISSYQPPTEHNPSTPIDARKLATENAVIVFGQRGCCMCHVVKRLLQGLGVNPAVHEVNEEDESELIRQLKSKRMVDLNQKSGTEYYNDDEQSITTLSLPAVFVGGSLFGGLDRLMSTHIAGELVPVLKRAGALWL
ncbi:unnamed protein product [Rhodiola kirilowii]